MSKKVLHQHKNKSLNKSQNREEWILGELLLLCDVLCVILPPLHLLTQTDRNRSSCAQTFANIHTHKQDGIIESTEKGS